MWPPPPITRAPSRSGKNVLLAETFRGLSAYALAPGREQRLAELIPHTATARQAQHDRQAAALTKRLKRLTARQDNLMRELSESFDMADEAGEAYRRRIRADYTTLHGERKTIETQLTELAADATPAPALTWSACCPKSPPTWPALPPVLQAELFDVFRHPDHLERAHAASHLPRHHHRHHSQLSSPPCSPALSTTPATAPKSGHPTAPPPAQTPAPHLCRDLFTSLYCGKLCPNPRGLSPRAPGRPAAAAGSGSGSCWTAAAA